MSSETSRLGLATRHPWKLISSPPKRGMVGKARLTRSIATVKAVRSSKTRGSVCALPRGIVPHMIMAFQNTPVNLGQRRSHSQFFIFDLAQSLARSGDARRNFRTAQTSLWRGSAGLQGSTQQILVQVTSSRSLRIDIPSLES